MRLFRAAGNRVSAVNVATALHQLAKRRAATNCAVAAEDVELLNISVGELLEGFDPQELANTLWAWATLDAHPGEDVLLSVGRCVERRLEGFNPQGLANALWAWATMGVHPGEDLLRSVGRCVERKLAEMGAEDKMQVFQAHLVFSATMALEARELGLTERAVEELREAWREEVKATRVSRLQRDVARVMAEELGVESAMEVETEDALFCIDIVPRGSRVAVEVDGPSHFVRVLQSSGAVEGKTTTAWAWKESGATLARHTLLWAHGWTVVSVPFFEWDACGGDAVRQARALLRHTPLAALAARPRDGA